MNYTKETAARLKARPGEWQMIRQAPSLGCARVEASRIRNGQYKPFQDGTYDADADDQGRVHARYVSSATPEAARPAPKSTFERYDHYGEAVHKTIIQPYERASLGKWDLIHRVAVRSPEVWVYARAYPRKAGRPAGGAKAQRDAANIRENPCKVFRKFDAATGRIEAETEGIAPPGRPPRGVFYGEFVYLKVRFVPDELHSSE